jgi:hypothetical protein
MKNLLVLCMLAAFGATMLGCHAAGTVDNPDNTTSSDTTYKKETTTVHNPDGTSRTSTEVHTNP